MRLSITLRHQITKAHKIKCSNHVCSKLVDSYWEADRLEKVTGIYINLCDECIFLVQNAEALVAR